jgi:acetyltransferase-like isoleucine patch superfamily enzyme
MIDPDVVIGEGTRIVNPDQVNLFGCVIGAHCIIGPFVEITRNVRIGDYCSIESHSFVCDGVTVEDHVFIGHGVMFVNDHYPRSKVFVPKRPTVVRAHASIGTNATIMGGVQIGECAIIGAGSVLLKDAPAYSIWAGNPARLLRQLPDRAAMDAYVGSRIPAR